MAQLTSDIVWLIEQEVTLGDGSKQKVLVPQLYVRVKEGDIDGSGAILSGTDLKDELRSGLATAILNTAGAQSAFAIGDMRLDNFTSNVTHAIAGCAVGAGRAGAGGGNAGSGCSAGAIGAVVGNLAAEFYDPDHVMDSASVSRFSRTMAGVAGVLVGGDVNSAYIAAAAGGNAVDNNRQLHPEERTLAQRLAQQSGGRYTARQIEEQMRLSRFKRRFFPLSTAASTTVPSREK